MAVAWNYFNQFEEITAQYLPEMGQGTTKATQIVTAVCKLVYKWYNDGDVYDNTGFLTGWCNDLSSYANWLAYHAGVGNVLDRIFDAYTDSDYEDILKELAIQTLDPDFLAAMNKRDAEDSIYNYDGKYRFEEYEEEEEDLYW